MKPLFKFLGLSWHERRVLLYACLLINGVRLALWLSSFNTVRERLAQMSSMWICDSDPVSLKLIVWAVNATGYYTPGGAKCLVKALVAQLLLKRYGYEHQLHIGVAKSTTTSTIEAHAWIEYKGQVIVGWLNDLHRFKPLSSVGVK